MGKHDESIVGQKGWTHFSYHAIMRDSTQFDDGGRFSPKIPANIYIPTTVVVDMQVLK